MKRIVPAALLALAALPACISVDVGGRGDAEAPEDRTHALDPSAVAEAAARSAKSAGRAAPVVAVRPFHAAGRFTKRVVRRDGPGRVTALEHDFWADEPADAVTDAVREALASSGAFAAAVDPADAHDAQVVLDGQVQEFAWAAGTPSRAVLRVRFTWSDARTGRVLVSRPVDASEDLPGPGPDGLGVAMARAVGRAVRASVDGLASLPPQAAGDPLELLPPQDAVPGK